MTRRQKKNEEEEQQAEEMAETQGPSTQTKTQGDQAETQQPQQSKLEGELKGIIEALFQKNREEAEERDKKLALEAEEREARLLETNRREAEERDKKLALEPEERDKRLQEAFTNRVQGTITSSVQEQRKEAEERERRVQETITGSMEAIRNEVVEKENSAEKHAEVLVATVREEFEKMQIQNREELQTRIDSLEQKLEGFKETTKSEIQQEVLQVVDESLKKKAEEIENKMLELEITTQGRLVQHQGEKYLASFHGVGICIVNLADDMQEYMRGIFLVMYAGPLATICYLHVKISRELQTQESSMAVVMFEARSRESRSRADSHSTTTDFRGSRAESDGISQYSRGSFRDREGSRARYEMYESELDVAKEKRNQKYLVSMVTMYAIFLCPLMVLRLARLALLETYDNSGHFDITYTTFVWFAFLPTCSTPLLFTSWQMSRPAKERLRGYFRFSNRKLRQSCEAVITAAGGTPVRRPRNSSHQGDPLVRRFEEGHSDTNSFHQDLVS